MASQSFYNGRILSEKGEVDTLSFSGEWVASIGEGSTAKALDLEGDYLIPGLVELHTDNLEKHFIPRTGVSWPYGLSAAIAHDMHMVSSGVTTVFDAITVGEPGGKHMRNELFDLSLEALERGEKEGLFRAEHFLHLRCEVAGDNLMEKVEPLIGHEKLRLFSVMDHTPGQRQWRDIEAYKRYSDLLSTPESEVNERIQRLKDLQAKNSPKNMEMVVNICKEKAYALASHDDTTAEHVREGAANGVCISEFPTTIEAAKEARELGLAIIMGAPNIVRGGSHSGNVAAIELAKLGLLDIFSSDYMPASLLHAAFLLPEQAGISLEEAIQTVTKKPAQAVGMTDRGELGIGKRADAVRVRLVNGIPFIKAVWREGKQVL